MRHLPPTLAALLLATGLALERLWDVARDPGDDVLTWTWDFGDGNTSTAANPSHTYGMPGSYTVCHICRMCS